MHYWTLHCTIPRSVFSDMLSFWLNTTRAKNVKRMLKYRASVTIIYLENNKTYSRHDKSWSHGRIPLHHCMFYYHINKFDVGLIHQLGEKIVGMINLWDDSFLSFIINPYENIYIKTNKFDARLQRNPVWLNWCKQFTSCTVPWQRASKGS